MHSFGNAINQVFLPQQEVQQAHQRPVPLADDVDLMGVMNDDMSTKIKNILFMEFAKHQLGRSDIITDRELTLLDSKIFDLDVLKMVYYAARSDEKTPVSAHGIPLYLFIDAYIERVQRSLTDVNHIRRDLFQTKEDIDIIDSEIMNAVRDDPQHQALLSRPDVDHQMIMATLAASGTTGEVSAHILHVQVLLEKLAPELRDITGAQAVLERRPGAPVHLGSIGISASCQGQHVATAFADLKRDTAYPTRAVATINEMLTFESSPHDANTQIQLDVVLRHPHARMPLHLGTSLVDFRAEGSDKEGAQLRTETPEGARILVNVRWSQQKCKSLLERRDLQIKKYMELQVSKKRAENHIANLIKPFNLTDDGAADLVSRNVGNALSKVLFSSSADQMSVNLTLALLFVSAISCFHRPDFLGLMLAAYIFHINLSPEQWQEPQIYTRLMILGGSSLFVDLIWMITFFFGWHWKEPDWPLYTIAKLSSLLGIVVKIAALSFFWKSSHDLSKRIRAKERVEDAYNANLNRV
eukprot:GDKJ01018719.1.p1 GENE.GDKJ01018719.1~~GDKJ01018719.1.p1  ORF type:complete len:526 (+),score=117.06 GDKJ01018719.1:42-1619(+)